MKIGIVSNLYPPFMRGGAEYVVVRTVEALMDKHHDVFVVTGEPKRKGDVIQKDSMATERIYRFFPKNVYFVLDDYKHMWGMRLLWHVIDTFAHFGSFQVRKVMNEEHPDVMITHNLKGIGLRIPRVIQRKGVKHVHVVHDLQLIIPSGLKYAGKEHVPFYVKPFYSLYQKICKRRLGKPDLVIFPSQYLKQEYLSRGFFKNTEVSVLPNPAPKFNPIQRTSRRKGPLRLLFVGQLESHKGIMFLLDEFKKLEIDAQLIIAGEGKYVEKVKKRAKKDKRIIYLGYISLEQLVSCFGIADALIVPSLCYENSPTVIYESLKAGVPVIASDIGGVGELVQEGENGFLFKPGSSSDFARVIRKLDAYKEQFAKNQDQIKSTVAPYALDLYTEALLKKIKEI